LGIHNGLEHESLIAAAFWKTTSVLPTEDINIDAIVPGFTGPR
jgi:hypothetical protein